MKPLLNLDEPVQRRTGEPAEILKHNALGDFPVIALMTHPNGTAQFPQSFTLRGSWTAFSDDCERPDDLINVPPVTIKVNLWLAIALNGGVCVYVDHAPSRPEIFRSIKEFNLEIEVP